MSSERHYNGETVYMGIDVHKNSYSVVSIYKGMAVKKDRMIASPEGLVKYINKYFVGAKVNTAYEAGFSGFHLHRYLTKEKIENIVVHPASIEVSRERVKNDKRDAQKIAKQLSDGDLKSIYIPDEERESKRMVTRLRSMLVKNRTRLSNQIKALLFQYGLIKAEDESIVSKKWVNTVVKNVNEGTYPEGFKYTVQIHAEEWFAVDKRIKEVTKKLTEQAEEEKELDDIYRSVPGIGPLSARILANELGDMKQFSNEKKLFSFSGLTPREYSSGDKRYLGGISKQGRPTIRKILVEAAWAAIRKDPGLEMIFEEIGKRRGAKRAIVGIARRLLSRIRSCILKNEEYKIKPCVAQKEC
jgi:transposase